MRKTLYLILILSIIPSDLASSEQNSSLTGVITFMRFNPPQPTSINEFNLKTLRTQEILRGTDDRPYIRQFRYAPDNQHFVAMMGSIEKDQADTELYIGDESSKQLKQLTENNIFEGFPVWSADNKKIVFVRGIIRKSNRFYVIDIESMQEKQVPEPNLKIRRVIDWLSDGKQLIVLASANIGTREDMDTYRLAVIHLNKGTARWLTKGDVSIVNPRLSPDRNKIVFIAQSRNPDFNGIRGRQVITRVHVLDIDAAAQMKSLGDSVVEFEVDIWPVWAPDGNQIAWIRINIKKGTTQILVYNLETKKLLKIRLPGKISGSYSLLWSPDNEHLACVTSRQRQNYTLYIVTLKNNSKTEVMNTKSQIQCLYWR